MMSILSQLTTFSRCRIRTLLLLAALAVIATSTDYLRAAEQPSEQSPTDATRTDFPASWYLIVSGIGGEPHYSHRFRRWSQSFAEVVSQYQQVEKIHIHRLAEAIKSSDNDQHTQVGPHTDVDDRLKALIEIDGASTLENIQDRLEVIADKAKPGDNVVILFIGHGSSDAGRALFNIPGPDLSAQDLRKHLTALSEQTLVLINTTSSSSAFLQSLAEPGRIVITATSNPAENQHTYFAGYLIEAFASDAADSNKDKQVSLLEAFSFAVEKTERHYTDKGSIATEHAMLDDDGDGLGSTEPGIIDGEDKSRDGAIAALTFLHEGPRSGELITEKSLNFDIAARSLVDEIESLKRIRSRLAPEDYDSQLEALLVTLAENRRDLKKELESVKRD